MKIGIMGGTFDPIHNAHIIIARYAKEEYELDKVMFMTGGNPPHKSGVTDKLVRNKMTELGVDGEFEINTYEVDKEDYSYSLHTLEHFNKTNPDDEIFFIIGEDSLRDILKWYKPQEILKLCTLLVFPRTSYESLKELIKETKLKLDGNILPINAPIIGFSSTMIRERIRKGKSIKNMVPDNVADYIHQNRLYKPAAWVKQPPHEPDKNLVNLRESLSPKRMKHSLEVYDQAITMALKFCADVQKAGTAGLYHDCAKGMSIEEQLAKCEEYGIQLSEDDLKCPPVIHAPLGAEIAKREYGINDEEILNAIRRHTVAGKEMTLLDKIIYVADMIEPGRDFEGVETLRMVAGYDLDKAYRLCLKQSLEFNEKKGKPIHPDTVIAYEQIMKGENKK